MQESRTHLQESCTFLQEVSYWGMPYQMSPSSNSVYSSVFTYNPYVLTRLYRHLTFVALIGPH